MEIWNDYGSYKRSRRCVLSSCEWVGLIGPLICSLQSFIQRWRATPASFLRAPAYAKVSQNRSYQFQAIRVSVKCSYVCFTLGKDSQLHNSVIKSEPPIPSLPPTHHLHPSIHYIPLPSPPLHPPTLEWVAKMEVNFTCAAMNTICRNPAVRLRIGNQSLQSLYCRFHACLRVEAGRACLTAKLPRANACAARE